jgi:hypothetical protein
MDREQYVKALGLAFGNFMATLEECLHDNLSLEEINDEFMLELYEQTKDKRRI